MLKNHLAVEGQAYKHGAQVEIGRVINSFSEEQNKPLVITTAIYRQALGLMFMTKMQRAAQSLGCYERSD